MNKRCFIGVGGCLGLMLKLYFRYSAKSLPTRVCEHDQPAFRCSSIKTTEMLKLHQNFYVHPSKKTQDAIILKLCSIKPIGKRTTSRVTKQTSIKYSVFVGGSKVPICQKFFLSIFGVTKHRVSYVMKKFFYVGEISHEARGGFRQHEKFSEQKQSVKQFIQNLKCMESHYCRKSKCAERQYLPPELNIKKLYNMYKHSEHMKPDVKLSYFRYVFNNFFNIGFGSPQTDVCSTCLELSEKLKLVTNAAEKNALITQKRVHKLRAKAFFDKLREQRDDLKIISFDCQKNLPIPKLPDQICYYSRQLYLYNFTMVEGSSNQPMTRDNVFAYCCTEDEFHKDSNLISSAIYHRLNETDKTGIKTIRLVADGCGGQNKNSIVIAACSKWLLSCSAIKSIEIVFPVTGHSYMPPDRTFGVIEKKLKRQDVILHPDELKEVISQTSTVLQFGDECPVYDWREAARKILAPTTSWRVRFKECKRFILVRSKKPGNILVRGETLYKSDIGTATNICKRQKSISMINPKQINKTIALNKNKLKDINNLLNKHFGKDWPGILTLEYYKNLNISQESLTFTSPPEGEYCHESLEEVSDLRI